MSVADDQERHNDHALSRGAHIYIGADGSSAVLAGCAA